MPVLTEEIVLSILAQTGQSEKKLGQLTNTMTRLQGATRTTTRTFRSAGGQLTDITKKTALTTAQINKLGKATVMLNKQGGFLGTGQGLTSIMAKVATWSVATGILYGGLRTLKQGISTITEFDSGMVGLRKVFQGTSSDLRILKTDILDTSVVMGSITQDTIGAAIELGRMGKSRSEISELVRVSLLAQNIAEIDAADATKFLNAAVLQFNKTADDAIEILDKWNLLSNRTPVETRAMAEAVSIAGAVFNQAGGDIEDLNSYVSTLTATMAKNGREIGTALKTISSYAYRQQTMKKIMELTGIAVKDQHGNLMDLDVLLAKLSARWGTLVEAEQEELAQTVAGVRRKGFFLNLMENFNMTLENQALQWKAAGSSMKENEIRLESLATKLQQLQASFEKLAVNTGDAGILTILKGMTDGLRVLINNLGEANLVLTLFAGGTTVLAVKSINKITASVNLLNKAMAKWFIAITVAVATFNGLIWLFTLEERSRKKQQKAIEDGIKVLKREKQELNSTIDAYETLKTLYEEYERLRKQGKDTTIIEERLKIVLDGIRELNPELITGTEDYATALDKVAKAARSAAVELAGKTAAQLRSMRDLKRLELTTAKRDLTKSDKPSTVSDMLLGTPTSSTYFSDLYKTPEEAREAYSRGLKETGYQETAQLKRLRTFAENWENVVEKTKEEAELTKAIADNIRTFGDSGMGGIDDGTGQDYLDEELKKQQEKLELLQAQREYALAKRDGDIYLLKLLEERKLAEQDVVELLKLQYEIEDLRYSIAVKTAQQYAKAKQTYLDWMAGGKERIPRKKMFEKKFDDTVTLTKAEQRLVESKRAFRDIGRSMADTISDAMIMGVTDGLSRAQKNQPWNSLVQDMGRSIALAVTKNMVPDIGASFGQILGGNLVGGLIAGGFGILSQLLFPVEDPINRNTEALEETARTIRSLDDTMRGFYEKYINVPSTFTMPPTVGAISSGGGYNPQGNFVSGQPEALYPYTDNSQNSTQLNFNIYASDGMDVNALADTIAGKIISGPYQRGAHYGSRI